MTDAERIAALERQLIQQRASYLMQFDELHSNVTGLFETQRRFLKTCLEASAMTPPRTHAIEERVEMCLDLIAAFEKKHPRRY